MAWAGAYALLATVVAGTFAAAILLGPYRAVERSDYMTYHVAARIVLEGNGACLYQARCQADAQRELIGEEPSFANGALPFNSPPWLAAAVAPLGWLPLRVGFAVFTVLGLTILAWGTWRAAGHAGLDKSPAGLALVLLLTSWPTAMAVIRGQSTLLVVGLLGLSAGLARYRSGLALGLSLLKPTLPPLWGGWQLFGGHWRAVGSAALVGLALVGVSALVVGPQSLFDYPAHLFGVAGGDALGVHPVEMVNWRGASERLGLGAWFVVAGSLATAALVGLTWLRTRSRHLGAAGAFLATPLVLPHANQHEFVLATMGMLLAVAAVPELRRRLATAAIVLHPVLWAGVALDAQVIAWLLFGIELGWLLVVVWISGARVQRPGGVPLPTRFRE
jgi:hypothetical protein